MIYLCTNKFRVENVCDHRRRASRYIAVRCVYMCTRVREETASTQCPDTHFRAGVHRRESTLRKTVGTCGPGEWMGYEAATDTSDNVCRPLVECSFWEYEKTCDAIQADTVTPHADTRHSLSAQVCASHGCRAGCAHDCTRASRGTQCSPLQTFDSG